MILEKVWAIRFLMNPKLVAQVASWLLFHKTVLGWCATSVIYELWGLDMEFSSPPLSLVICKMETEVPTL